MELVDTPAWGAGALTGRGGSTPLVRTLNLDKIFTVYAISSLERSYIYVGLTSRIEKRLSYHHRGYEKTTKPYRPFDLLYTKDFSTRMEAREHEKYLKGGSGKEFLKSIRDNT